MDGELSHIGSFLGGSSLIAVAWGALAIWQKWKKGRRDDQKDAIDVQAKSDNETIRQLEGVIVKLREANDYLVSYYRTELDERMEGHKKLRDQMDEGQAYVAGLLRTISELEVQVQTLAKDKGAA